LTNDNGLADGVYDKALCCYWVGNTHLWLTYKNPRPRDTLITRLCNNVLANTPLDCVPKSKGHRVCHLWRCFCFVPHEESRFRLGPWSNRACAGERV
jgi:hypothetical protein